MATEHELHKMRYDRSAESMSEKIVENCEIIRENELTHGKKRVILIKNYGCFYQRPQV